MRTLLIRPGAIGDCIAALPVLKQLATSKTEVWVPSAIAPLVQFGARVRSLASSGIDSLALGEGVLKSLSAFDSIFSWYGANRPEFRESVAALPFTFYTALPAAGNTLHITDFLAAQVNAPSGLIPHIDVGPVSPRKTIVIHPFSGGVRKNWPLERFRGIAAQCPLTVEWSAGPEEILPEATRFESLLDLARWLAGAHLYIGNDSGITHLAAAVGIPVLALFVATDPQVWAPRGTNVTIMQSEPLRDLSPDAVLAQVHQLLPASSAR